MVFNRILAIATLLVVGLICFPADADRGVGITAEEPGSGLKVGKQYLVAIAVSKYQQWAPLSSPVEDTMEIRNVLVSRYCMDRVYELYDEQATKANIIKLFVKLQEEIQIDDSLLILYAGHGHLDKSSNTGFWIPVNAGTDVYEQQNWLPHTQLRGFLSNIRASHLFVISDSCFAGDLIQATRSMPSLGNPEYFQKAYSRVSRQVLTSGATEAVPDVSDFAYQLKSILERNRSPYLDSFMLYNEIRLAVSSTVPLLGALAGTGHQEGASFLLFLKSGLEGPKEMPASEPDTAQQLEAVNRRIRRNYLSSGLELSTSISVGNVSSMLNTTANPWLSLHYNIGLDWGLIGVGFLAAAIPFSGYHYNLVSFPIAVELRYRTIFNSPFYLQTGMAIGAALNVISINYGSGEGMTTLKLFVAPSLGAGLRLLERLRIAAILSCLVIFFDNNTLLAVSPGIGVEYAFR